ncbi:MAG: TIR domain-containing protein [Firmicutes bacterium]|nr:TIR domain-containing protein [Bacillota bacterium]
MVKRQVFFSFHYDEDNWRAAQVRNMGKVAGNSLLSDNDWEKIRKSNTAIMQWIDNQMNTRSCLVVLIGSQTSNRKWIIYEIKKAYELKKGIVGIRVHNLKDKKGEKSHKGSNPFYNIFNKDRKRLSTFVKVHDPPFSSSKRVYQDIENNIEQLIETAIATKGKY